MKMTWAECALELDISVRTQRSMSREKGILREAENVSTLWPFDVSRTTFIWSCSTNVAFSWSGMEFLLGKNISNSAVHRWTPFLGISATQGNIESSTTTSYLHVHVQLMMELIKEVFISEWIDVKHFFEIMLACHISHQMGGQRENILLSCCQPNFDYLQKDNGV